MKSNTPFSSDLGSKVGGCYQKTRCQEKMCYERISGVVFLGEKVSAVKSPESRKVIFNGEELGQ